MFDISVLKEMKLSELQEIAKTAKTIKFNGLKKETLINLILDHQVTVAVVPTIEKTTEEEKPKRARIVPTKKSANQKNEVPVLFDNVEEKNETQLDVVASGNDEIAPPNSDIPEEK